MLTPKAPLAPRINGPRITGVRPGKPFLFRIPCSGERPVTFTAEGLPPGITLDSTTGILSGASTAAGSHRVTLAATNPHGTIRRELHIVVGDSLALTPPMGWNSWYIHYNRVTEPHLREAADQMIPSGMADHGYQYVNIDDCWMKEKDEPPFRDAERRSVSQRQVSRHQGHGGPHSFAGLARGHLHFARTMDLRGLRRILAARGPGRPLVRPDGF